MADAAPFHRIGPAEPTRPVILSVPHAGRAYSAQLLQSARVSPEVLEGLEDRLVDRLIWRAVAEGAVAIVAAAPRAEIDLNRDEREVDPQQVAPAPRATELMQTARTRGGLGLVPSRLAGFGNLWRGRISRDELNRRIETIHRPYHAALGAALAEARRRFGVAVLIDCHSMPPRPQPGADASVVLGDRHGKTAASEVVAAAIGASRRRGFVTTCNHPYAGGHVIERHGRPASGVHALQVEIDRALYLDERLKEPGPRFDAAARLIADIVAVTADAALGATLPMAAE
jgi:N-formylglutamate amidohydrolase